MWVLKSEKTIYAIDILIGIAYLSDGFGVKRSMIDVSVFYQQLLKDL